MAVLHLNLKAEYFDAIAAGEKVEVSPGNAVLASQA